jgi:predicted HTH domain antitoxin
MMTQVTLRYPTGIAQAVRLTNEEFEAQVRLMAALKMFELGKLSSGKAAELAGLSRVEFLEACGRYRVPVFNYPPEELEAELRADLDAIGPQDKS